MSSEKQKETSKFLFKLYISPDYKKLYGKYNSIDDLKKDIKKKLDSGVLKSEQLRNIKIDKYDKKGNKVREEIGHYYGPNGDLDHDLYIIACGDTVIFGRVYGKYDPSYEIKLEIRDPKQILITETINVGRSDLQINEITNSLGYGQLVHCWTEKYCRYAEIKLDKNNKPVIEWVENGGKNDKEIDNFFRKNAANFVRVVKKFKDIYNIKEYEEFTPYIKYFIKDVYGKEMPGCESLEGTIIEKKELEKGVKYEQRRNGNN